MKQLEYIRLFCRYSTKRRWLVLHFTVNAKKRHQILQFVSYRTERKVYVFVNLQQLALLCMGVFSQFVFVSNMENLNAYFGLCCSRKNFYANTNEVGISLHFLNSKLSGTALSQFERSSGQRWIKTERCPEQQFIQSIYLTSFFFLLWSFHLSRKPSGSRK